MNLLGVNVRDREQGNLLLALGLHDTTSLHQLGQSRRHLLARHTQLSSQVAAPYSAILGGQGREYALGEFSSFALGLRGLTRLGRSPLLQLGLQGSVTSSVISAPASTVSRAFTYVIFILSMVSFPFCALGAVHLFGGDFLSPSTLHIYFIKNF